SSLGGNLCAALCAQGDLMVPARMHEFVQNHCVECHGGDTTKGGLDMTVVPVGKVGQLHQWSRMRERVHAFEMPPVEISEVSTAERRSFTQWIDALLEQEVPRLPADPGQVTVRRLSRGQWRNTVRDLLGVHVEAAG